MNGNQEYWPILLNVQKVNFDDDGGVGGSESDKYLRRRWKKLFSTSDCVNYLLLLFVTVLFQTQLGSSLFSVKIQSIVNINGC